MRQPVVVGQFYPGTHSELLETVNRLLQRARVPDEVPERLFGATVPHAGYLFSGYTAACAFKALQRGEAPETFVLFGAVHSYGVAQPAVSTSEAWLTPLGPVEVDEELREKALAAVPGLVADERAHSREHSLEVQLPLIQVAFPGAKILPIAMPPITEAPQFGAAMAEALEGESVVFLGSSDLTHYGPGYGFAPKGLSQSAVEWVKQVNDASLLKRLVALEAEAIVPEAARHHNACGAGALAACCAACRALGAKQGYLVDYRTSFDVLPNDPTHFVGYGAVVFG